MIMIVKRLKRRSLLLLPLMLCAAATAFMAVGCSSSKTANDTSTPSATAQPAASTAISPQQQADAIKQQQMGAEQAKVKAQAHAAQVGATGK